jgi:hypothetical protein
MAAATGVPSWITLPVDRSKKRSADSSIATSIVSPSRIRVRGLKRPTSVVRSTDPRCSDHAIVADVLGQLADLLGDRCARPDRKVHQHLRAERFAQLGPAAQAGLGAVADQGCVVHCLGADAEHDLATLMRVKGRICGERLLAQFDADLARGDPCRPVFAHYRGLEHVHRGAADEPGDEHVPGPVIQLLRRCDRLQHPLRMTDTRSPIVIASIQRAGEGAGQSPSGGEQVLARELHASIRLAADPAPLSARIAPGDGAHELGAQATRALAELSAAGIHDVMRLPSLVEQSGDAV